METPKPAARTGTTLASVLAPFVAAVVLTGCVSQGDYDVLRNQYEEQSERLADRKEALERCDKERSELESTHTTLLEEHESVAAELEEAQGKLTAWQNRWKAAEAREDNLRQTVDRLQARLRTHATTFRLSVRDIHRGRIFGLRPGEELGGKLGDHLGPHQYEDRKRVLLEDVVIELDGITHSALTADLDQDDRIRWVEIHFYGSGEDAVDELKSQIETICSADDDPLDFNPGRPGPGTPKTDPLTGERIPLVVLSKYRCGFDAGRWEVSLVGEWAHDSADLNRMDLQLRFEPRQR